MRSTAMRVLFILLHGVLVTSSVAAAGTNRTSLVVRTYDAFRVGASDWDAAVAGASRILANAGIQIEWVHCSSYIAGQPATGPARCSRPYSRNEVALRLVVQPLAGPAEQTLLGDSMVDGSMHFGTLATIYLASVERLAGEAKVNTGTVMARAIAHELGHLLLGTNTHSVRGLMRPVWTAEEMTRNEPADWSIPRDEGQKMRLALARRGESQNG